MTDRAARVQQRAHELWLESGRPDDKAQEHWAQAEREIEADTVGDEGPVSDQSKLGTINGDDD